MQSAVFGLKAEAETPLAGMPARSAFKPAGGTRWRDIDFFPFSIIMLAEVLLKSFFKRNASHYQSVR
jgi:hypothetical protein